MQRFESMLILIDLPHATHKPLSDRWTIGDGSAVCLLFVPGPDNTPALTLIKRSTQVSTHKGQIGLPGGHKEAIDLSPRDTALRELNEELGVPREAVSCLGELEPVRALSRKPVVPVLAYTDFPRQEFSLQASEVAELFFVPWHQLKRGAATHFEFTLFGMKRISHLFLTQPHRIWGLTANIIFQADFS